MISKPAEIFTTALSLEPGKRITLSFKDRKRFLSVRSALYTTKKALNDETVKISSIPNTTIILQLQDDEDGSMSMNIEDISIEQEIIPRKTHKNQEGINIVSSLEKRKDIILEELKTFFSLLGPEQASIDRQDPESELYSLETKFNKIQKQIRDARDSYGIHPDRYPTLEPPNEKDLIEDYEKDKAHYEG